MIKYKAEKFRSKYKINNKTTLSYLKLVIHKLGCNLSTYSDEAIKLATLNLSNKAKTAPALSDMDNFGNITVFYNDQLPIPVQRIALAHELGHIVLGHLRLKHIGNKQERAADKFVEYLLSPKEHKFGTLIQLNCIILCICLCIIALCIVSDTSEPTQPQSVPNESYSNSINDDTICYYAQHSEVYHLYRDCYYLKNSKTIYTDTVGNCDKERLCSACKRKKYKNKE